MDRATVDRIIQLAQAEGVVGIFANRLLQCPDVRPLPPDLAPLLRRFEQRDAPLELIREAEYRRILDLLAAADIRPLLIKGTALAYSLYPHPQWRSRCDLDLVFPNRATVDQARRLLVAAGYTRPNAVNGDWVILANTLTRCDRLGISHSLDLHWSALNQPALAGSLGFAQLAAAAQALPALGPHARIPSLPHAILIACLHRIANIRTGRANRLIWLYDIHLIASRLDADQWRSLAALARARGVAGLVLDGLQAAHANLDTGLPDDTLADLGRATTGEWLTPGRFATEFTALLTDLRALPGWRAPLQLIREHLYPSADYMRIKYAGTDKALSVLYLRRILNRLVKPRR